jgi:M6 family metalloprotease-like protein
MVTMSLFRKAACDVLGWLRVSWGRQLFFSTALTSVLVGCGSKVDQVDRASLSNCKLPLADGNYRASIGGFPRQTYRLKSVGEVKVSVVMVDFSDAVATKTPAEAYAMISGAKDTFTEVSYGRLTYTLSPTYKWYRMSKTSTSYNFSSSVGHSAYIKEAMELADAEVDFSTTDMILILSNPDSKDVGNFSSRGPIWLGVPGNALKYDGKEIYQAATSAYDLNTWGSIWLNHESTHGLGLIDLYAATTEDATNPWDTLRYTGGFSYMGFNSFTSNAPGLLAWERWLLAWLDDSQVQCANPSNDGAVTATLTPIETSGGLKAVVVPVSDTKAVVVELRQALGINSNLTKAGVVVYTVDSSISTSMGAIKVYPSGGKSDPLLRQSTRAQGESVEVENLRVDVTSASSSTSTVRIVALNRIAMN